MPLWNKLQDRKRKLSDHANIKGATHFKMVYASLAALLKAEPEWAIKWILSVSDATPQTLLKAKAADKDAINKIFQGGTQMEMKQKLSSSMQVKDVMWAVLTKLHVHFGSRLQHLNQHISIMGLVDYLGLSPYEVKADAKTFAITELKFMGNVSDTEVSGARFTTSFQIKNVWVDGQAVFHKNLVSPTRLDSFWSKNNGPKSLAVVSKGTFLSDMVGAVAKEFQDRYAKVKEANNVSSGSTHKGMHEEDLQKEVKKIEQNEKNEKMAKLKARSKEAMNQTNRKKMVPIKHEKAAAAAAASG